MWQDAIPILPANSVSHKHQLYVGHSNLPFPSFFFTFHVFYAIWRLNRCSRNETKREKQNIHTAPLSMAKRQTLNMIANQQVCTFPFWKTKLIRDDETLSSELLLHPLTVEVLEQTHWHLRHVVHHSCPGRIRCSEPCLEVVALPQVSLELPEVLHSPLLSSPHLGNVCSGFWLPYTDRYLTKTTVTSVS